MLFTRPVVGRTTKSNSVRGDVVFEGRDSIPLSSAVSSKLVLRPGNTTSTPRDLNASSNDTTFVLWSNPAMCKLTSKNYIQIGEQ